MVNAGDENQVRGAERKIKHERELELRDLCAVLATRPGRRLIWRLMGKCKVFESIWEQSARIHYNSGQQDIGQFLLKEVVEANEESLFQMMREAKVKNEEND